MLHLVFRDVGSTSVLQRPFKCSGLGAAAIAGAGSFLYSFSYVFILLNSLYS